jgi:hypothetical protein
MVDRGEVIADNRATELSLRSLCEPRASVFDRAQIDTVVDIGDLTDPRFDVDRFFEENHPTQGMETLLRQIFERLCGSSPQGVFRLKQAMGGGKTHNMVAAGLLAKHPHLRGAVLSKLNISADSRAVAVAAFTGREGSVQDFLWLEIARQLSRADRLRGSEADVPGQTAWVNIIGDKPSLILLDELPPYFELLRRVPGRMCRPISRPRWQPKNRHPARCSKPEYDRFLPSTHVRYTPQRRRGGGAG